MHAAAALPCVFDVAIGGTRATTLGRMSAEEGTPPDTAEALRGELAAANAQLKQMKIKEQLLLTRVAELEAKYEPNAVRSPAFKKAFGDSPFARSMVECVFTEPGSLGLKMNDVEGRALVVKVNAGTQGEQHPQTVGLLVAKVADTDVTAMNYAEVLSLMKSKAKVRPLTLLFEPQATPEAAPAPAPAASPTPKVSKKPKKSGNEDDEQEQKRRQRQFSLSHPDFAGAGGLMETASASPTGAPAGFGGGSTTPKAKVSRRTSVYAESHPDFAAAAAAALSEESEDEIPAGQ